MITLLFYPLFFGIFGHLRSYIDGICTSKEKTDEQGTKDGRGLRLHSQSKTLLRMNEFYKSMSI